MVTPRCQATHTAHIAPRQRQAARLLLGVSILSLMISSSAFALDINAIQSSDWNNAATWDTGTIPTSGDSVTIAGHDISVQAAAQTGSLTFKGGGITGSATVNFGANPLQANMTVSAGSISADLAGSGQLWKDGSNTLTLSGNNTYSGGTVLLSGTLALGSAGAIGTQGSIVFAGGTLQYSDQNGTDYSARFGSNANQSIRIDTNDLNDNLNITFATGITSLGTSLTKLGIGTLTLTGNNTYTGGTIVSEGTLKIGNGGTSGSIAGNVSLDNSAAALRFARSDAYTYAGAISGQGTVLNSGAGTLTLTGNNSYTGDTYLFAGTLNVGSAGALGTTGTIDFLGGTLQYSAANQTDYSSRFNITAGMQYAVDTNGQTITWASNLDSMYGTLTKLGAGTLILSGASNYWGGTTISAGVLQVTNSTPGTSSSIGIGPVTFDGGTLQAGANNLSFSNALRINAAGGTIDTNGNAMTLSGVIGNGTGVGALTKIGGGNLILTGTSTYSGATTVNDGTLSVNGSITSAVTVNNGGVLGGNGVVGGVTIAPGGVLAPGNSIGTIAVNGNVNFGAGGIYRVEVSPSAADRTNASGTATLTGATVQAVYGVGNYVPRSYTILSAAGGLGGTRFAGLTGTLPGLATTLSYTNTDVVLNLGAVLGSVGGQTPNQQNVAGALNTVFNTGGTVPGGNAIFALSGGPLGAALGALSGEVHASTVSALQEDALYLRGIILSRLRQFGYGSNDAMAALQSGGPLAFAAEGSQAGASEAAAAMAFARATKAPAAARPTTPSDLVFWTQGIGSWGRLNGDGNAATVSRDEAGVFTGLDTRLGGNGRGGFALGYTGANNRSEGLGSSRIDSAHAALYGGTAIGRLALRGGGSYAYHAISTDRSIAFPGFADRASASYSGGTAQMFGEAAYGFAVGKLAIEPFAGGAFTSVNVNGAREQGGAAALNLAGTRFDVTTSNIGLRFGSVLPTAEGMVLSPRASLSWQHAFGGLTPLDIFAFQSAPAATFAVAGTPIARDALLTEAGVDLALSPQATIGIAYSGKWAPNAQDHSARGRFSWRF